MQKSTQPIPELGDLFFAVCFTAIKNTAWKRVDFEKVQFVEGQLAALRDYLANHPRQEKTPAETENLTAEDPAKEDPGVEILNPETKSEQKDEPEEEQEKKK